MTPRRKRVVGSTKRKAATTATRTVATKYDPAAIMAVVCEQHGEQGRYLHDIATDLAARGTPVDVRTIKRYAKLPDHAEDWQCAKEAHAAWHARRATQVVTDIPKSPIVADGKVLTMTDERGKATPVLASTNVDVQIAKLRRDDAVWQASKADARAYGDKVDVTSGDLPLAGGVMVLPAESWGRPGDADPVAA